VIKKSVGELSKLIGSINIFDALAQSRRVRVREWCLKEKKGTLLIFKVLSSEQEQ
jgi:hypothetical protein